MIFTNILRATRAISNIKIVQRHIKTTHNKEFNIFFRKNLLFINSITSGICMFIGDFVHQEYEKYSDGKLKDYYDWRRAGNMFIVGTLMGPLHHFYYIHLDKLLPQKNLKTIFAKLLGDQLVASPLSILSFFYGMGVLEGRTITEINKEISQKVLYVYLGDCLFWPPVQFINFYFLPTHYRVIYVNAALIIYDVFLAFMKYFDQ